MPWIFAFFVVVVILPLFVMTLRRPTEARGDMGSKSSTLINNVCVHVLPIYVSPLICSRVWSCIYVIPGKSQRFAREGKKGKILIRVT